MMNHICKQNGSTLIEILVSMVVIMITALGGIALYFNSSELKSMATHKKIVIELANSKMEEYRAMDCASIITSLGTDDDQWVDYSVGGLDLLGSDGKGIKTHVHSESGYCEVEVRIKWNEVGQINRDFDITLITYVAP